MEIGSVLEPITIGIGGEIVGRGLEVIGGSAGPEGSSPLGSFGDGLGGSAGGSAGGSTGLRDVAGGLEGTLVGLEWIGCGVGCGFGSCDVSATPLFVV